MAPYELSGSSFFFIDFNNVMIQKYNLSYNLAMGYNVSLLKSDHITIKYNFYHSLTFIIISINYLVFKILP